MKKSLEIIFKEEAGRRLTITRGKKQIREFIQTDSLICSIKMMANNKTKSKEKQVEVEKVEINSLKKKEAAMNGHQLNILKENTTKRVGTQVLSSLLDKILITAHKKHCSRYKPRWVRNHISQDLHDNPLRFLFKRGRRYTLATATGIIASFYQKMLRFSLKEWAILTGQSKSNAFRTLRRMEEDGVVLCKHIPGKRTLYIFNDFFFSEQVLQELTSIFQFVDHSTLLKVIHQREYPIIYKGYNNIINLGSLSVHTGTIEKKPSFGTGATPVKMLLENNSLKRGIEASKTTGVVCLSRSEEELRRLRHAAIEGRRSLARQEKRGSIEDALMKAFDYMSGAKGSADEKLGPPAPPALDEREEKTFTILHLLQKQGLL